MMTTWLIFGGARGTGALVIRHALDHQQPLVAVIRNEEDARRLTAQGVKTFTGDASDADVVLRACQAAGKEATVVSTLGGSQELQAHRTVIDCAEKSGIRQMLLVTSLGCGDSWGWLSPRAKQAFGRAVREKSLAESWLQTSSLAWCIIRPGGLMNGSASLKGELSQNKEVHGLIRREDVALAIMTLLAAPLDNQIYSLTEPGLTPQTQA